MSSHHGRNPKIKSRRIKIFLTIYGWLNPEVKVDSKFISLIRTMNPEKLWPWGVNREITEIAQQRTSATKYERDFKTSFKINHTNATANFMSF